MQIIYELDHTGFRESIEIIPLYHVDPTFISNGKDGILEKLLAGESRQQIGARNITIAKKNKSLYFSPSTKVVPDHRSRSLIIMGKKDCVQRVKNFILKYIDRPMEDSESILHVYHLKHLKAQDFHRVLLDILKPPSGSQSQTSSTLNDQFKDVLIMPDSSPKPVTAGEGQAATIGSQYSGNRLVIAARKNDWIRIKELIDELDQPQLQVALEFLVVDLEVEMEKILGSQTRNRSDWALPDGLNMQSSHLTDTIIESGNTASDALKSNMVADTIVGSSAEKAGSFFVSLKDSGNSNAMWSILKLVNRSKKSNVLAHPFLITRNTFPASVKIGESRLSSSGSSTTQQSGATKVMFDRLNANLTIEATPIISPKTKIVNLNLNIEITSFSPGDENPRSTRTIATCANVRNKEVLVLGGLTKTQDSTGLSSTPVLGKVPVFGWLFKSKTKTFNQSNLTIFICPTILSHGEDVDKKTFVDEKFVYAKGAFGEGDAFADLRDPITHWLFKSPLDEKAQIKRFFSDRFKENPKNKLNGKNHKEDRRSQKIAELAKDEPNPFLKDFK